MPNKTSSLDKLFMDVAVYNTRVMGAATSRTSPILACRTALGYRGVAHINFPVDMQDMSRRTNAHSAMSRVIPSPRSRAAQRIASGRRLATRAAKFSTAGSKIAILAGRGALDATDELEAVAEILGAPIIKALLGKAAVPDDSPYTTGGIGLLGTTPSQEAHGRLRHASYGRHVVSLHRISAQAGPGAGRADRSRSGRASAYVIRSRSASSATARKTLNALLPMLQRNEDRSFLNKAQQAMTAVAETDGGTRHPTGPSDETAGGGLGTRQTPRRRTPLCPATPAPSPPGSRGKFRARRGQMYSLSGTLATMANGLPYTIAAQIAYPERQCVAFVGDGGFSMLMAEFVTAVKYQLPIKVVIIKNNTLGQIKWEQMVFLGNPEYGCDLQPIDFAAFARACGASGFTIEEPLNAARSCDEALGDAGSGHRGGDRRPVRAAHAGKNYPGSGEKIYRVIDSRHAAPGPDRAYRTQ